jgi:hypothetical protein
MDTQELVYRLYINSVAYGIDTAFLCALGFSGIVPSWEGDVAKKGGGFTMDVNACDLRTLMLLKPKPIVVIYPPTPEVFHFGSVEPPRFPELKGTPALHMILLHLGLSWAGAGAGKKMGKGELTPTVGGAVAGAAIAGALNMLLVKGIDKQNLRTINNYVNSTFSGWEVYENATRNTWSKFLGRTPTKAEQVEFEGKLEEKKTEYFEKHAQDIKKGYGAGYRLFALQYIMGLCDFELISLKTADKLISGIELGIKMGGDIPEQKQFEKLVRAREEFRAITLDHDRRTLLQSILEGRGEKGDLEKLTKNKDLRTYLEQVSKNPEMREHMLSMLWEG